MTRMKMRALLILAVAGVFLLSAASVASAKVKLVPKVDSFVIFQDYSGSMAMKHQDLGEEKIVLAKQFLKKFNAAVPNEPYEARLTTFAPYKEMVQGDYDRDIMGRSVEHLSTGYDVFARLTPIGKGLSTLDGSIASMKKDVAVILLSDGRNNLGMDPVEEARNLYAKYPGQLCIHVVSFADEAEGQRTLDAIAGLNPCAQNVSGTALLEDDAAMQQFVKDVFYDEVMVKEPKPEPVMEEPDEEVIPLRVNFDFDSSRIKEQMVPILDEAASIIKDQAEGTMRLEGHTCNIGTDEYNMGLSLRRANSVRDYLIKQGVDAKRLSVKGYGESMPKYDNTTREGRRLNRRVEIIFNK